MLKPHPGEEHVFYFEIEKKLKTETNGGFALIYNEYIWDTLNAADLLLERSCTTGIEAWMKGLPTIEMQIYNDRYYYSENHAGGSIMATSMDEAFNNIDYFLRENPVPKEQMEHRRNFLNDWCYKTDGRRTLVCAYYLSEIAGQTKGFGFPLKKKYFKAALEGFAGNVLGRPEYESVLSRKSPAAKIDNLGRIDKWVTADDILSWEKRIKEVSEILSKDIQSSVKDLKKYL